jgi:hypothetical protein
MICEEALHKNHIFNYILMSSEPHLVRTLELSRKQQGRRFTQLGDRMCDKEVQSRARKDVKTRGHSQFIVCLLWILQPVVALSVKTASPEPA